MGKNNRKDFCLLNYNLSVEFVLACQSHDGIIKIYFETKPSSETQRVNQAFGNFQWFFKS